MNKDHSLNNSGFDQEEESNYSEPQTPQSSSFKYINSHLNLPKPIPIAEKPYSLEPDMIFGWTPKLHFNGPIKLTFNHLIIDTIVNHYLTTPTLVYLGFRPNDSIRLHKQFSQNYHFRFEHLLTNQKLAHLMPLLMKDKPQRLFTGMNPKYPGSIIFDSLFEGGNLDTVIEVAPLEFDLFMRVDSNTKGHFSWYNFKVKGSGTIKINIVNFTKAKSLYNRGMCPYICQNGQWKQGGTNVKFKEKNLNYDFIEQNRRYFTLSFEIHLDSNELQIAYCIPYPYSQMLNQIKELFADKTWAQQNKLCQDLSGIDVPLLTIDEPSNQKKKIVVIQARIHPGESNGSWMMDGFLQFVASDKAKELRQKCILKIIPMANPDGVVLGNYRTGMAGRDLNREFLQTDEILYPTVQATKQLIKKLIENYGSVFGFIDMHGHSLKKNVFIYGPDYSIYSSNYLKCRMLPKLLNDKTSMFRYYACIFRVSNSKRATARGVFTNDILHCFTVEASNGSYILEGIGTQNFISQNWIDMGKYIGESLSEVISQTLDFEQMIESRQEVKRLREIQKKIEEEEKEQQLRQFEEKLKEDRRKKNQSLTPQKMIKKQNKQGNIKQKNNSMSNLVAQIQIDDFQFMVKDSRFEGFFNELKKMEEIKKYKQRSDSPSEGGSDSESSDDDYNEDALKQMKKEIQNQREINQRGTLVPVSPRKKTLKTKSSKKNKTPKKQRVSKDTANKKSQHIRMNFAINVNNQNPNIMILQCNTVTSNQTNKPPLQKHVLKRKQQMSQNKITNLVQPNLYENEVYRPLTALDYLEINDLSNRASRFQSQQFYGKLDLTPFKSTLNLEDQNQNSKQVQNLGLKEQLSKTNINFFKKLEDKIQSCYEMEGVQTSKNWYQKDNKKHKGQYPMAFHSLKKQLQLKKRNNIQQAVVKDHNYNNYVPDVYTDLKIHNSIKRINDL